MPASSSFINRMSAFTWSKISLKNVACYPENCLLIIRMKLTGLPYCKFVHLCFWIKGDIYSGISYIHQFHSKLALSLPCLRLLIYWYFVQTAIEHVGFTHLSYIYKATVLYQVFRIHYLLFFSRCFKTHLALLFFVSVFCISDTIWLIFPSVSLRFSLNCANSSSASLICAVSSLRVFCISSRERDVLK